MINIKSVCAAVLALLLILTFLSKTVYSYNLPTVTAALPFRGNLNKLESASGTVNYREINKAYAKTAGKAKSVLAREGDAVTEGQPIIEMDFEEEIKDINKKIKDCEYSAQNKKDELKISADKLQIDIEEINASIADVNRKIEELRLEIYEKEEVTDFELIQCENEISSAEEEVVKARELLKEGVISGREAADAEDALNGLRLKYESLRQAFESAVKQSAEALSEKEKGRQKQIRDYEFQLETFKRQIKGKETELNANSALEAAYKHDAEKQIEDYREALADYESNKIIRAPKDSAVVSIGAESGQYLNANQELAGFGASDSLIVDCAVSRDNGFIKAGDECSLSNSSHSFKGTVVAVVPEDGFKKVTVLLKTEDAAKNISAGETFDVLFEKESAGKHTLVPNGALNMDGDGYFLKRIKRRDGILGKEFYTEKLRVIVGDSDSENSVITKGLDFFEPVALISDKPFSEGETVKLKNESDFFEE